MTKRKGGGERNQTKVCRSRPDNEDKLDGLKWTARGKMTPGAPMGPSGWRDERPMGECLRGGAWLSTRGESTMKCHQALPCECRGDFHACHKSLSVHPRAVATANNRPIVVSTWRCHKREEQTDFGVSLLCVPVGWWFASAREAPSGARWEAPILVRVA